MRKKGYSLIQVVIIIIITSIISGITTGVIYTRSFIGEDGTDYSEYTSDENIQDFLDVYSKISNDYYEDINKKNIIDSAINGMMDYLDESYTSYLDESDASSLMNKLNGTYEGLGITLLKNEIIEVLQDSPASRAGLEIGDIILNINNQEILDQDSNEITSLIKSNADNIVIGILRGEDKLVFNLRTEKIKLSSVESKIIEVNNIGYLKIDIFSNNSYLEVKENLEKLESQNIKSLIIDLRNNTGGYLDQAYKTAQLFTQKGKLIYSINDKGKKIKYKDNDDCEKHYPVVILINKSTASAAEVLTAALKDSYGATIVGQKSYGKGKIQHTYSLNDGGIVKYTTSTWIRPNGETIDEYGINPDIRIENIYTYGEDGEKIIDTIDKQYEKAIELLSN